MNIECTECRKSLRVPDHIAGKAVRCPSCSATFTAPMEEAIPTVEAVEPASEPGPGYGYREPPRRTRDDGDDRYGDRYDSRPPRRRRYEDDDGGPEAFPRKSGAGKVWLIVIGVVVLIAAGVVGLIMYMYRDIADSDWTEFKSPDGQWSAQFPGKVTRRVDNENRQVGMQANTVVTYEYTRGNWEFGVITVDDVPHFGQIELVLDQARDNFIQESKGRLITEKRITSKQGDHPGRELVVEITSPRETCVMRVYMVRNRMYMILVGRPNLQTTAKEVKQFLDSFQLLNEKPGSKPAPRAELPKEEERPQPPLATRPFPVITRPPFPSKPLDPIPPPTRPVATKPADVPPKPRGAPPAATDLEGCIAYWSFDEGEGDVVNDSGPFRLHGKRVGCEWSKGIRGGSLKFESRKQSFFKFGCDSKLDIAEGAAFTLSGWVKTNRLEQPMDILVLQNGNVTRGGMGVSCTSGNIGVYVQSDGNPGNDANPASVGGVHIADGKWHHFAVTRDKFGYLTGYFDGIKLDERIQRRCKGPISTSQGSAGLKVALIDQGLKDSNAYDGELDEIAFFSRELSPAEIKRLAGFQD